MAEPFLASAPPPEPADDPFAAVPVRERHDGWTPARQRDFIEALAETGNVSRAAARVGLSPESAYKLRRHRDADDFRRAWAAALHAGVERLTDIAFQRAIEGVAEPVFYKGEIVGERRRYDNRLLMFTLRHHDPHYDPRINQLRGFDPQRFHAERGLLLTALLDSLDPRPT